MISNLQLYFKLFRQRNEREIIILSTGVTLLTNILSYGQFSCAVEISQTLRDQNRRLGEASREIGINVEVQLLCRTVAIGLSDFFFNVRRYHVKGLRYVESNKVRRFQLHSNNKCLVSSGRRRFAVL